MDNMNSESTERSLEIKAPVFVIDKTGKKVTEEQLQQWRDGNALLRKPLEVGGDQIRKRVESQILQEFEAKGLNPFEFDYSDSNVLLHKHMESRKGKDINDVIEKDKKLFVGNTKVRQNN